MRLEAKDISFSYKSHQILSHVSLKVEGGELVSLLGRNGSGKTTLLRILLDFIPPQTGIIEIDGEDAAKLPLKKRALAMAYIPQSTESVFSYSVLDYVLMGRSPVLSLFQRPGKSDEDRCYEVLEMLGIYSLRKRSVNTLSGGERQLVLIARAIAQNAKILLLDEPTSALDYSNQILVLETLDRLRQSGYALILTTHDPGVALTHSTRIIALSENKAIYNGEPEGLMDGQILSLLYGRKISVLEITRKSGRRIVCIPE